MYCKKFEETQIEQATGNRILVPRSMTESLELGLVRKREGEKTPLSVHVDEEEAYIILKGRAIVQIGRQKQEVSAGMVAYVPKKMPHRIECLSDELEYIYSATWPGKVNIKK